MLKLIKGLQQFQSEVFHSHKELFEKLAKGQNPEILFITCSDSRINPNMLTQTEPGDLFILRNAGNIVPPYGAANGGEGATIEYAVAALGVKHIIVCGHSHCGAMKGLLHPELLAELPSVSSWLNHAESTRRTVKENYKDLNDDQLMNITIQENVLSQIDNLKTHPAVAARLSRGEITIHGWVYKIESGDVFSYQQSEGQFSPLIDMPKIEVRRRSKLTATS